MAQMMLGNTVYDFISHSFYVNYTLACLMRGNQLWCYSAILPEQHA